MKLALSTIALALSATTFAQNETMTNNPEVGSFGGSLSIASGYSTVLFSESETSGGINYSPEIYVNYKFAEKQSYQLGLGLHNNSVTGKDGDVEVGMKINYFQIIFGSLIEATPKVDIFMNTYMGLPYSAELTVETVTVDAPDEFMNDLMPAVGLSFGGAYDITNNIYAGARVNYDLLPIMNYANAEESFFGAQLVVGYNF